MQEDFLHDRPQPAKEEEYQLKCIHLPLEFHDEAKAFLEQPTFDDIQLSHILSIFYSKGIFLSDFGTRLRMQIYKKCERLMNHYTRHIQYLGCTRIRFYEMLTELQPHEEDMHALRMDE